MSKLSKLPYNQTLRNFEKNNKILHRENIYGSGPPSPLTSTETISLIKNYAGKKILDIGCGIGAYIKDLLKFGFNCTGVEYDLNLVSICKSEHLNVSHMSAENLKFKDNSFDTVMMIEVLEHLSNPEKSIAEAFRVARKNVIISVPNIDVIPIMSKYSVVPWHLLEATHINFFTPKLLKNLLNKYSYKTKIQLYGHFAPWITEEKMYMHIYAVGTKSNKSSSLKNTT